LANDQEPAVIRRLARWLRLVDSDDAKRHAEARTVLAEAHKEIDASREARQHELQLRLEVRTRR